ncbi:MAG TPA: autorepressor SdpR family transcription factor [Vicinamibacterales bacterium]|nr:autorepressor SdpR family transcription factor [Vicinamibacterales bacterium]
MQSVFRALADETRRAILTALTDGPKTSGELADLFDSSWPTISRHLAVLRQAELVVSERRGQAIVYELNMTVFQEFVQHVLDMAASRPRRHVLRRQSTRQKET